MEEIYKRSSKGESARHIARIIKINRETVTSYLRLHEPPKKHSLAQISFTPFTQYLRERIMDNIHLTSRTLISEIRELGYKGWDTAAYNFIRNCVV